MISLNNAGQSGNTHWGRRDDPRGQRILQSVESRLLSGAAAERYALCGLLGIGADQYELFAKYFDVAKPSRLDTHSDAWDLSNYPVYPTIYDFNCRFRICDLPFEHGFATPLETDGVKTQLGPAKSSTDASAVDELTHAQQESLVCVRQALQERGHRLKTTPLLQRAFGLGVNGNHCRRLAKFVKLGLLMSHVKDPGDGRGRGYGLPEWED